MNGSLLLLLWLLLLMAAVVRVPLLAFVQFHHGRILVAGFVGAGAVVEAVTDEDSANVVVENGSSAATSLQLLHLQEVLFARPPLLRSPLPPSGLQQSPLIPRPRTTHRGGKV